MKNYMDPTGRTAIVTGASSGLGYEYCKALAENGAKVAAFARRADRLEGLREEIEKNGGTCLPVPCDVTKEEQVVQGVQKVIDTWGKSIFLSITQALWLTVRLRNFHWSDGRMWWISV